MKLNDFNYYLPAELIAQEPPQTRGKSRLMSLNKKTGEINDLQFSNLPDLLQSGDVLVLNDSKVLPARLYGIKKGTGAAVETVLLKEIGTNQWECLIKPGRRVKTNSIIEYGSGRLKAQVIAETDFGGRVIEFIELDENLYDILNELGEMPLPPYITKKLEDADRYQTVYAKNPGSAAAPTAGLHFTEEILHRLEQKGVNVCYITLHVGLGTFRPVQTDQIEDHTMHAEYYEIPGNVSEIIHDAMSSSKRIVAVGTTCVRTLETAAGMLSSKKELKGWTDIFIYPGYEFKIVDAMITNFHLPKSTLVMMVSAFSSREIIMNAYRHAIEQRYRFFSFGDAMFIF